MLTEKSRRVDNSKGLLGIFVRRGSGRVAKENLQEGGGKMKNLVLSLAMIQGENRGSVGAARAIPFNSKKGSVFQETLSWGGNWGGRGGYIYRTRMTREPSSGQWVVNLPKKTLAWRNLGQRVGGYLLTGEAMRERRGA